MKITARNGYFVLSETDVLPAIAREDFEDYQAGFAQGFPLPGEELPPMPEHPSPAFLRGLEAGRKLTSLGGQGLSFEECLEKLFADLG